mmetsp:Transcript_4293/g.11130  ORF Transcript_4293/g.11130 Transcript_4293/m.11130 type:complete len:234 (+) Transcript_4293:554-1255(+)
MCARAASTETLATKWSWTAACTNTRESAAQKWPWVPNTARLVCSAACSTSASEHTMTADLTASDAYVSRSTSGCDPSAAVTVQLEPGTTLKTPGGTPARAASSAAWRVESDVAIEGWSTTLLPAASAGAASHIASIRGREEGVTAATTPTGLVAPSPHAPLPCAQPVAEKLRSSSTLSGTSAPRARDSSMPESSVSSCASSSACSSISSANRRRIRPRSVAGIRAHGPERNAR